MDELIRGDVRVQWSTDAEEGYGGDYDPDDPDDALLLRFYVSVRGPLVTRVNCYYPNPDYNGEDWVDCDDGSYCTEVPASATDAEKQAGLEMLMGEVEGPLNNNERIKKLCERLSWISLPEIQEYLTNAQESATLEA